VASVIEMNKPILHIKQSLKLSFSLLFWRTRSDVNKLIQEKVESFHEVES
jgi:hypothetical protein